MAFLGEPETRRGDSHRTVRLREKLNGAHLVITGEGRTDFQTLFGKTPMGVARAAMEQGIPVVIISGSISDDARGLYEHGIGALVSIARGPMLLDEVIERGAELVADAAESVARLYLIGAGRMAGQGGGQSAGQGGGLGECQGAEPGACEDAGGCASSMGGGTL